MFKTNQQPGLSNAGYRVRLEHSSSSAASLSLVFPGNRIANVTKMRGINQNDAMVILREARNLASPMLRNSKVQIVGHANVERGPPLVAHHKPK
jgi:hypothetical protein